MITITVNLVVKYSLQLVLLYMLLHVVTGVPLPAPALLQTAATTTIAVGAAGAAAAAAVVGTTKQGKKRKAAKALTPAEKDAGARIRQRPKRI